MDWSTRRDELRWYLREHSWWWKWPLIVVTLAVWVGALALFASPFGSDAGNDDDAALTIETEDSAPDVGPPSWPVADSYADELFETERRADGSEPVEPVSSELAAPLAPLPTEQGTIAAEVGVTETSVVESTRSRRSIRPAQPEPEPVAEPFIPVDTISRTTTPPASSWTFAPFPTLPSSSPPNTTVAPWPSSPTTTDPPPPPTTAPRPTPTTTDPPPPDTTSPPPDTTAPPPPPPPPEPEP